MRDRNIQFLEAYKSVDHFLKDAYQCEKGVGEYLAQMEVHASEGRRIFVGWERDYKALKHARWVRNQLAHDVSIDSDICEQEDYDWICDFQERLMSVSDPLAQLRTKRNTNNAGKRYDNSAASTQKKKTEDERSEKGVPAGLIVAATVVILIVVAWLVL